MTESKELILHVGPPKTGTTALQYWCDQNRSVLAQYGVLYPEVYTGTAGGRRVDFTPKHGFLVNELRTGPLRRTKEIAQSNARAILLSTEGLTNHFYEFDDKLLAEFRELFSDRIVTMYFLWRDKDAWFRSIWKEGIMAFPGTTATLEEYIEIPAIKKLSDWATLKRDMRAAFNVSRIETVDIKHGWRKTLLELLDIPSTAKFETPQSQVNVSLPDELLAFVKEVNGLRLDKQLRELFFKSIQEIYQTSHNSLLASATWQPGTSDEVDLLIAKLQLLQGKTEQAHVLGKVISHLKNLENTS